MNGAMFMNTMFTDGSWQIIGTANMNDLFYSRHDCRQAGDRSWMCFWERNCTDCDERVPESVQTVLRLLVGTNTYGEDRV